MTAKRQSRDYQEPSAIKADELKIDTVEKDKKDEIGIDDDDLGTSRAAAPAPAPAPSPEPDAIAELKKQLSDEQRKVAAEKARADRLEEERKAANDRAVTERKGRIDTEEQRVLTEIEKINGDIAKLEADQEEALNNGDNKKAVMLGRQIAKTEFRLEGLEYTKGRIEQAKIKAESNEPESDQPTQKAKAWIDANPEFNTNRVFHDKALAAHYAALADGVGADSDEYFQRINEAVGKSASRKKEESGSDDVRLDSANKKPEDKEQPSFDGAPPSRNSGGEASGRWIDATTYRPTSDEIEAAEICGFGSDVAAYIRAKYPERFKDK